MSCYCTLHINSTAHAQLPADLFLAKSLRNFSFTDNESAERRARRARLSAQGINARPNLPRYWWQMDTDGIVDGTDIHAHVYWLLAQLKKGRLLCELAAHGYEYWLSVYWGGNGTGGGPLITRETIEMLKLHDTQMGISFYYKDGSS